MDAAIGSVIDGYTIVAPLGAGGAARVYRAASPGDATPVALKLLDSVVGRRPEMKERFEREARALNGLDHPNLIRLIDFGMHEGTPYLVTELLDGQPLDRMLASRPLPPTIGFELALGVVAGLAHAHMHKVLHRDLKPANVFVATLPGGALHAKLLDFGLARFFDPDRWGSHETLTQEGTIIGTPTYMAPEQGFGGRADERSDVYSAGVLLYELLALRPPFVHVDRAALIRAHALEPHPPIEEVRRGLVLERSLVALVDRALAKKPRERFFDAADMLRAMQNVPKPVARYV